MWVATAYAACYVLQTCASLVQRESGEVQPTVIVGCGAGKRLVANKTCGEDNICTADEECCVPEEVS